MPENPVNIIISGRINLRINQLQMKTYSHNNVLSFGPLAIIFGFIATVSFLFFKALFGSDAGLKDDLTAAFMGAFFAFLFVRLGEGLTLIYKRKTLSRNSMVRLQHHFNDCLNILNDNIFVIDTFFDVFKGYDTKQQHGRVFANRLQIIPIEKALVVDLNNLDFINEVFTLQVDIQKLNDSMNMSNRMIEGITEAFLGGRINLKNYVENIDHIRPQMEELKKFLSATMEDVIKALASSKLLLKNEPILSTIIRLSTSTHYSSSHKKRIPDEVARLKEEIEALSIESEERINKIKSL
jgi:hypothetical protein